jgi:UDP-N-acetylmuramoylalanine--D-glutamate ligase
VKVLVLGAAVSGRAAARLAHARGSEVTIYDRRSAAVEPLRRIGEVISGDWEKAALHDVDLVVTSPGFPEHVGPIPDVMSVGIPLVSEMEYAVGILESRYAAVTGTNGKTTVTSVAADMLVASGVDAAAAGNIGTALSDIVLDPPGVIVIEASSFQLRFIDQFHPSAAAILNIAPDHLDWHHGMSEYVAAKQRIFENQTTEDILVYDADDAGAATAVMTARARRIPVSGHRIPDDGYGPEGTQLLIEAGAMKRPDLDPAYTMDLVAAATIADHLGATLDGIAATVESFMPGTHRRSVVGTWAGVTWVNDSKATNPHAALASVAAFSSVVLIAGGRNKGLDLAPITAAPSIRKIIGIGEAAVELEAVSDPADYQDAADLAEAISIANSIAVPGDTVLLAPGCASFDMFESYEDRGEEFGRLVRLIKGDGNGK